MLAEPAPPAADVEDASGRPLPTDAAHGIVHPEEGDGPRVVRMRRLGFLVGTLALSALVLVAATDGVGWTAATGVSASTSRAAGGGYEVAVRHPAVTRGGLSSPFEVRIERAGGFDGPVQVALPWSWLEMWDANGWYPEPSASWGTDDHLVLELDPPSGEVLRLAFDARIEPGQQQGGDGRVAVLEDGEAVVAVAFHTRVLP